MITQDRLKELVDHDPGRGVLLWKKARRGCHPGDVIGTIRADGYRTVLIDGHRYTVHRLIWLYVHGELPMAVDHIDQNPMNNLLSNLRAATVSQNMANRGAQINNTSGLKGVCWDSKRHGFANGRDDRGGQPRASASALCEMAEEAMRLDDADAATRH